jgi:hypothetical protein
MHREAHPAKSKSDRLIKPSSFEGLFMSKINPIQLLIIAVFLFAQSVFADEASTKKEVPYKLVEGKQYEICNALLPFINTVPHGTLRDQPELLEKVKDFKLPDWKPTKDLKFANLLIKYSRKYFPDQFTDEKYEKNFEEFSGYISKGELRLFTAYVDIDNSGKRRSVFRRDEWFKGTRRPNYLYFPYDEKSMEVDKQYSQEMDGSLIFYKGRTFQFSEWPVGGDINDWKIGIDEPYYDENRPQRKTPPVRPICMFSMR